jgi:hypothetical protein
MALHFFSGSVFLAYFGQLAAKISFLDLAGIGKEI